MSCFSAPGASSTVDRRRIADRILLDIKEQILNGDLPSGSKLPTERALAERYQVAGPTIREAIRGLTAMGLADVRHGSGAYVTADPRSIVAQSLGAVIQLEELGAVEVLSVQGVLIEYAARMASRTGAKPDHARLQHALDRLDAAETVQELAIAVRDFHHAIALAAHNPLLSVLCGFLADVQAELAVELTGGSVAVWRSLVSSLAPLRSSLVDAIVRGEPDASAALAREFHLKAVGLITSLPKAKEARLRDPALHMLLGSMMARIDPNHADSDARAQEPAPTRPGR